MPLAVDVATLAPPEHALVAPLAAVTTSWKTIVVRPGDTLWDLAIRYRTTSSALAAKNRLHGGEHLLVVGRKLLVPGAASSKSPSKAPSKAPSKPPSKGAPTASGTGNTSGGASGSRTHVVAPGETMTGIAKRYGLTLTKLLAANRLANAGMIYVGQRITVPGTASASPAPAKPVKPAKPAKPSPLAAAVAHSKALLAGRSVPSRTTTAAMIRATALRNGVDPRLALSIGWQESGWNQRSVSYTNAVGVMQIMPVSGTWASQLAGRKLDLYDAQDNITAGVLILRTLQRSADSREQAIAAYYQGLPSVRSHGLYTDTKAYVASILKIYARM